MKNLNQGDIPLSINTDLRLHPQQLKLGKAELLTDAITLPFTDIESKLSAYAFNCSEGERKKLCNSMKSYLGRLNANPLIPLSFRLKVLKRFEKELNLFDGEMTAAVLNSHKIAITLVQKEAREESHYYSPLVEMIANAVELAGKILQLTLESYQATPVIATRQFFELARLGLDIIPLLDEKESANCRRLTVAICRHELLRAMDFYSKTIEQQQIVLKELAYHVDALDAFLLRSGEHNQAAERERALLSNINRPNDPPALVDQFQGSIPFDAIVLPVDKLLHRLTTAVDRIEELQASDEKQSNTLYTEEAVNTTRIGGNTILDAITMRKERLLRNTDSNIHLHIEWDSTKAFIHSIKAESDNYEKSSGAAWRVINRSDHGCSIEQLQTDNREIHVGSMIGIIHADSAIKLGFIRWMKQSKSGETQLGICYFSQPYKLVHANIESGSKAMNEKRSWPLLVSPGKGALTAYFPENRIYQNMVFIINSGENRLYFKVREISETGPNYCKCFIVRARTGQSA